MSIFESFTDRMSHVFRVVRCGYRNYDYDHGFTTRSKMLGRTFHDPSSYPPIQGRAVPPDMKTDYVLNEQRFECFVGGKRKWIKYNQIFDVDVHCVNDFMVLVALGGDFDKSLPMYTEPEPITHEDLDSTGWYWTTMEPQPDCSEYWSIVGSHIEQNIKAHVRPGCQIDVKCIPDTWDRFYKTGKTKKFRIELYIKSINNDQCFWFDVINILQRFNSRVRMNEFYTSPTIIFDLTISKDE